MATKIAEMWERFAKIVLPNLDKESVQYKEMRKAFFSGAIDMFTTMKDVASEMTERNTEIVFKDIEIEIRKFAIEIMVTSKPK